MKLLLLTVSSLLLMFFTSIAQNLDASIHEQQLAYYNSLGKGTEFYESQKIKRVPYSKADCNLEKVVYGWHPYWVGSAYENYQWDLLSHMSFFSYEVNSSTGESNNSHGWSTSAAVDAALASGNTKVTLCVTLFSGHSTFFGSANAQQTLITNLINLIQSRGAHGVNIDFEGLPSSQTTNFANFMVNLANQMHAAIPGSEVSTVLYAVDWNNVFDFSIMEPAVDHYIIMGYGYYYTGSATAGPTDPLYHFGSSYNYTLSRSITYYLDKGCPKNKLVLGLPNYGYEWPTNGLTVPSSTIGSGTARTFSYVKNNTSTNYSVGNHIWEADSYTDVYAINNGENRQCLISLETGWQKRLDHVRKTGIAGIGIWALGYDNGYTELWDAMESYLTDCYEDPCSGTIHDFGGPTRNYYDNEDYTWTLSPPNATSIDMDFTMFDVELNFDYLYIYDGDSDAAPQIAGSPFTGLTGPGSFTSSTGSLTFRFTSDGATKTPGFLANYTCNTQQSPVADFSTANLTVCNGDSIQLINTSTDGESFLWSVSEGTISNTMDESPYLYPTTSGGYDVSLTVTNGAGTDNVVNTLNVVVEQPPIAGMTVNATSLSLPNATAFFTNTSTNADSYFWSFGDGNNSTDTNPWHDYLSNGTYNGFLVALNDVCENDTTYFTIHVGEEGLLEISGEELSVYPNPFNDHLIIKTEANIESIYLLDLTGKKVDIEIVVQNNQYVLSTNEISAGMYFLEVEKGLEKLSIKVQKH